MVQCFLWESTVARFSFAEPLPTSVFQAAIGRSMGKCFRGFEEQAIPTDCQASQTDLKAERWLRWSRWGFPAGSFAHPWEQTALLQLASGQRAFASWCASWWQLPDLERADSQSWVHSQRQCDQKGEDQGMSLGCLVAGQHVWKTLVVHDSSSVYFFLW